MIKVLTKNRQTGQIIVLNENGVLSAEYQIGCVVWSVVLSSIFGKYIYSFRLRLSKFNCIYL